MNFKVGDRVRIYGSVYSYEHKRECNLTNKEGTVTCCPNKNTLVFESAGLKFSAHPKQLRRLVKKPRKRIWVSWPKHYFNEADAKVHTRNVIVDTDYDLYEFIEVRKAKK